MPRTIKMATNRINAQKSTGPKSAEGKQTVSRNAIKHGLSGSLAFSENECKRIDFYTNAFLDDCDVTSEQSWMAREAAEAQVTLERIKGLKHEIWQIASTNSGRTIVETPNPFANKHTRNELFEIYDEAPPHIQKKIRSLYDRVNRAGSNGSNLIEDYALSELLKLKRYEQKAANRRDKSLRNLQKNL